MEIETDTEDGRSSGAAFLCGLLAGGVVGAALGLLFAPRAGSELRAKIGDQAASAQAAVSSTVDELSERGRKVYDRARKIASRAGDEMNREMDRVERMADRA